MVLLDADDGQSVMGAVGDNLVFADGFDGGATTVTPTFFLENSFTNTTALRIDPTFDMEVLSAFLGADFPDFINALGIADASLTLEPLFEINLTTPGPAVNVFNQSWMSPFDSIQTASFVVNVPEPGALALFGIGLLALGASGALQRRRQALQLAA